MAANDDWLARTVEPTLEPELPIRDPHHYLWDFRRGGVAPRYLLDEFLEDPGIRAHRRQRLRRLDRIAGEPSF